MKIGIGCAARFNLDADKATVDILHKEAARHYDSACRYLATPDGLLTKWQRLAGMEDWTFGYNVTWSELDLLCKVVEFSHDDVAQSFKWNAMQAMQYFNNHRATFPETTLESNA